MPEVHFTVQLPDGSQQHCYSPSTVVCSYFRKGEEMSLTDFILRSRIALTEASERVRAKYGFSCSSAAAQLAEIEHLISTQPERGRVRILTI
jgi:uncharacterized repeat protein (TIGR04042 family)